MFIPTIENQATPEQKERWLPKARAMEYVGTYAQTEMGHGTFLRGLETTATYDPITEAFILHTPSVSAMKWWPGGLGKTSNCAVVMAQLYSRGTNHGMAAFFVQLRDWDTHQLLPGIKSGDIGPKMGFNTVDNGYLMLDKVRIPREDMLMKNTEVKRDGTVVQKSKKKKATYSTMTMVRTFIVFGHGYESLAKALTIAIRYSAVRRQSELKPGAPEPQVMDYQTQQYKLYPYLAMAYGFWAVSNKLIELFIQGMGAFHSGDDTLMPELHALSSGLKAYCTDMAALGMEQARFSCGGHGYSHASGLPKLYASSVPACTYEGENTVMKLQTARYLMKCWNEASDGKTLPESVAYLSSNVNQRSQLDNSFCVEALVDAFEHRARRIIIETASSIGEMQAKGAEEYDARNLNGVRLARCSTAHCEMFVIKAFASALSNATDPGGIKVLNELCQLLAAYIISNNSGDFIEDGYMSRTQLQLVRERELSLLAKLRPNAVALVDAFELPDHYLGSVLGRYDGNVYENLYKWAQQSPLNKTDVHESYYKYLQPMIKSKI